MLAKYPGGRIHDFRSGLLSVESPAIKGNLLGESSTRQVYVHLPPSYNYTDRSYPVLYFLAGYGEFVEDWVSGNYSFLPVSDRLMTEDSIKEMIVVLVDGKCLLDGHFYTNSPVTGNWEVFLAQELPQAVDRNFRTLSTPGSRAVAGHSMGGYGALNIAMKHPNIFGTVFAHTPGVFAPDGIKKSVLYRSGNISHFHRQKDLLDSMDSASAKNRYLEMLGEMMANPGATWEQMFVFAYASAFSPDGNRPPYSSVPFGNNLEVTNAEVLARWESGFGAWEEKIPANKEQLMSLRGIGLLCGTSDYFAWITEGTRNLSRLLTDHGLPHLMREAEGGHESDLPGRFGTTILPFISSCLE